MDGGDLVPDDVIIGVILERLRRARTRATASCSTASRARSARPRRSTTRSGRRSATSPPCCCIDAPDEEIVRRISGRRVVREVRPRLPRRLRPAEASRAATSTARDLIQRDDDKPETVRKRLEVYHEQTAPLVELLRGAGPAAPLRRHAQPDRGARPHPRDDRHAAPRRRRLRPRVIIKKSPQEIEKMAAAGAILVAHAAPAGGARSARASRPRELDEAAEKFIRSQGAEPAFKGYRGFPGSICASPNSMVVHGIPGPYQLAARRHHLDRRRRRSLDGWVADAARTFAGRPGDARSPSKLLEVDRGVAVRRRRAVPARQPPRATSRTPCRRASRTTASRSCARSSATASGARCTRTRRSRTSASPAAGRCSRRAWSSRSSRWSPPAATCVRMGDDGWAIYSQDGSLAAHFEFTIADHRRRPADPHALAPAGGRGGRRPGALR